MKEEEEEELRAPSEPQKEAEEELWELTEQEIPAPPGSTYLLLCLIAKMREEWVYIFQPYDWLVTTSPLLLLVKADNN